MSDIKLSLPSSATPLASSGPVGEARGIGADASPEDAATAFANLLQDAGFVHSRSWVDANGWFAVFWAQA